ncbi:myeloid leukemia factor isoform X2 [Anthonomus grandis grandis]|uniref:myeloid leukemia factor isoform X2 n=1 Tax=Anthonomus grandis grandis TaxID=2921223 RepID=UPI0021655EE3|nr:myeloid leukemia factor isoform X2 [Anthonomus grandis grandis]
MSMSLFGSLMGMDDDPFFGSAMRQMRSMDNMMNSIFQDSFGMGGMPGMFREFDHARPAITGMHTLMSPFGMPPMMHNLNRLMSSSVDSMGPSIGSMGNGHFSSSSTVISMTSGPDGRPQVYKATSSTKVAPGGIKETQRTVSDSVTGTKKMAIGHHIGERAHIIEKEQNMHTGNREEREDFINLDEDEAEDFNKEWETKTRCVSEIPRITYSSARNRHAYGGAPAVPAITAGSSRRHRDIRDMRSSSHLVSGRRSIRGPKLALPLATSTPSSSSQRTPYTVPGQEKPKKNKNVKIVSGTNQEK